MTYIVFLVPFLFPSLICWYGRLKIASSDLYSLVANGVVTLLTSRPRNSKIQFYALLALGSMVYGAPNARDALVQQFGSKFAPILQQAIGAENLALKQVAKDCKLLYQLE